MNIRSNNLQDFDSELIKSGWIPPVKSNSFHTLPRDIVGFSGEINLYTDQRPRLRKEPSMHNFIIDDNGVITSYGGYYGFYNDTDRKYYKAIYDASVSKIVVTDEELDYPGDPIFTVCAYDIAYDIFTNRGIVPTGNFTINSDTKYRSLTVIADTELHVNGLLWLLNTDTIVHGVLQLENQSTLSIMNNSVLRLYSDSIMVIPYSSSINIQDGSKIEIYGSVDISQNNMDEFISNPNIYIDTAAVLNVTDIPYTGREFSLTDYESALRKTIINVYSQGKHSSGIADIGYTWKGGNPINHSQILDMEILWGDAILGDYKLSVLGTQETEIPDRQFIQRLLIARGTTLHIQEEFEVDEDTVYTYINPELYLGITIGNTDKAGVCICDGNIYASGNNCKIIIDRRSYLHITQYGSVTLTNGAKMISANNGNTVVLRIDGVLTIDTLDQLQGFDPDNIVFGDEGKLIILNPDTGIRKLLWTTPNGIIDSELYRLFVYDAHSYDPLKKELAYSRLRHIEYHISNNNGIGIDEYYNNYSVDMTQWYNGMRLERAIKEGLIVWHAGAFIESYHWVDPKISIESTLYTTANFFKHYGSTKEEMLQDVVNHFKYAGAGDITFRFYDNDVIFKDIVLTLDDVHMSSTAHSVIADEYTLTVDNDGMLFLRNKVPTLTVENIVKNDSKHQIITPGENVFTIE